MLAGQQQQLEVQFSSVRTALEWSPAGWARSDFSPADVDGPLDLSSALAARRSMSEAVTQRFLSYRSRVRLIFVDCSLQKCAASDTSQVKGLKAEPMLVRLGVPPLQIRKVGFSVTTCSTAEVSPNSRGVGLSKLGGMAVPSCLVVDCIAVSIARHLLNIVNYWVGVCLSDRSLVRRVQSTKHGVSTFKA